MQAHTQKTGTTRGSRRERGQTLIISLLVLSVLLVIGLVFAGIVSGNIKQTSRSKDRSLATDLAEAGVRYAHFQLLNSALGADWRPAPTLLPNNVSSNDQDALYLRPGSNLIWRNKVDRGGPDGLGPYTRVNFQKGRALIRVRYAPSDYDIASASGVLREPGRTRNYLMIESVGRSGTVNLKDPTTQQEKQLKVGGFADVSELEMAVGELKKYDNTILETRKMMAFVSIGIIESALFITDKDNLSTPAEIGSLTGVDDGLGVSYHYQGSDHPVELVRFFGNGKTLAAGRGSGSLHCNTDLIIHGEQQVFLDPSIGDEWNVAGDIKPANGNAKITLNLPSGQYQAIWSTSSAFSTFEGAIRDGAQESDGKGNPRSVVRKEPPSILKVDPATNTNRVYLLTRDSGRSYNGVQSGRYGHGNGVYCDQSDRANLSDEEQRQRVGSARSLVEEWLNPNSRTGNWKGPYYRPVAPIVQLLPDGFTITRDTTGASRSERYWRDPYGVLTDRSTIRYRLRTINNQTYILNDIMSPAEGSQFGNQLSDSSFIAAAMPFNGTVLFAGDVRVKGIIPTNHQMTVMSMGTIYIDGSITKGVIGSESTGRMAEPDMPGASQVISGPSRSMLMLIAKDYVALNTTQFFAPTPGEDLNAKTAEFLPNAPNPIELTQGSHLNLSTSFLLNPEDNSGNLLLPSSRVPYARSYTQSGNAVGTRLLLSHSADDNGPSFISLGVRPMSMGGEVNYAFPCMNNYLGAGLPFNWAIAPHFGFLPYVPIYGLADSSLNAFPKFESISLPFIDSSWAYAGFRLSGGVPYGLFNVGLEEPTYFKISSAGAVGDFPSKNYELARFAVTPHDIRIEAAIYAEEGSFFVIPGPPFNTNQSDSREEFEANVAATNLATAQAIRFKRYGSAPETPFFGEPLDVRVTIVGSVSENMPQPISRQAEWQRRWGWIPIEIGSTGTRIPDQHVPTQLVGSSRPYVPNLIIQYDPALALASANLADPLNNPLRVSQTGSILPPMPRLPVSPTLAYFGDVKP